MGELAAATNAPITVDISGKKVELHPLSMLDLGQYLRFVQFADYQSLKLAPDVTEAELSACRLSCAKKHITLESPDFLESLKTADGIVEILYLSARRDPSVTRETFGSMPLGKLTELNELLTFISGFVADESKAGGRFKKVAR